MFILYYSVKSTTEQITSAVKRKAILISILQPGKIEKHLNKMQNQLKCQFKGPQKIQLIILIEKLK